MKTVIKYSLVALILSLANVVSADKVCQKLTLAGNKIKQQIARVPSTAACPKGATEIINTATLAGATGTPGIPGPQGLQGLQGVQGLAGGFMPTLPSGQLMTGVYGGFLTATAADQIVIDTQTFPFALPSDMIAQPHYIKVGDPTIAECPGTAEAPNALAGHLCLFEYFAKNRSTNIAIFSTATGSFVSLTNWRLGFTVNANSSAAGLSFMYGSYAVRAR